ncbi:MAG: type II toxin-antitoxin system RelE/ParE family toxin [Myxococcales bacterium]|nr:type II toxin-antitoxin system RelE/ParE family toxin [Myxococcales bacterium]
MTRTVLIEPEAHEDLSRAFTWYEETNPGMGQVFIDAMREAVSRLTAAPDGSTTVPEAPGSSMVRRVLAPGFPYAVIFVVKADTVHVVAFAHMKRRPDYWHGRLPR